MDKPFSGTITRARAYPVALPAHYIAKVYRREGKWWGRLRNDIECWLIKKIISDYGLDEAIKYLWLRWKKGG